MSDESTRDGADRVLADCLEDYHRRRALGEHPSAVDYSDRVGERLPDLRAVLATEERVDAALGEAPAAPTGVFPRPFGEYTLLRELGRGAMGVVYEAVHRPLGRTVALKVLRTGLDTDAVALERFRREARACALVRHPHIVEVHDAGQVDGQPFYSMALLRGRTLHDLAEAGKLPALPDLVRGLADVADALGALHDAGIVHRDVKPSNILVAESGAMVLADFGLARTAQSERVTTTGQALGTPLYMSPEQILGRTADVDGRSDVYGLGATMYEVLSGRPLFRFEDYATAMRLIVGERPAPPRAARPDLPEALERIVLKCLEKEKADRYASAADLRDDLRNFAEGRSVAGRPVSGVEHGWRSVRRFLPAIAAVLVASVAFGWWWTHRDGTLALSCWPVARVTIDGTDRGETPLELRLPPGRHTMVLAQAGFAPRTEEFDLEAGARRDVQRVLIAQQPDDPVALDRVGRELGVAMATLEPLSSMRGTDEPIVRLLWPRGELRPEDAAEWRMDVSPEFEGSGRLEFRRGAEVVHAEPLTPTRLVTTGTLPEAVLARLARGETVTWAYVPEKGEPVVAEFTVTARETSPRLRKIREATRDQPGALQCRICARMLLDAGLPLAAYREARRAAEANPGARVDWVVMQHALDRMGLRDTAPWREAAEGLARAKAK